MAVKWYQSRGFWTAAIGGVLGMLAYFHAIPVSANQAELGAMVIAVLGGLFRWKADAPLSL